MLTLIHSAHVCFAGDEQQLPGSTLWLLPPIEVDEVHVL